MRYKGNFGENEDISRHIPVQFFTQIASQRSPARYIQHTAIEELDDLACICLLLCRPFPFSQCATLWNLLEMHASNGPTGR
jgi:hypothetical protein